MVAHAAEPCDGGGDGAGQGGDVETVARVLLEVVEIDEGGLPEVVVGQFEVSDLGGHNGLRAGGERGVSDGERLVVGEVPRLLLVGERVAAHVQRQHEVGLLEDLLPVEIGVGKVQEQRVLLRPCVLEVPELVAGEAFRLRVDAEPLVPRDHHLSGGVSPGCRLLEVGAETAA